MLEDFHGVVRHRDMRLHIKREYAELTEAMVDTPPSDKRSLTP
ncbi:hypothetical protein PF010_g700 [Phytophthora fragariae]|uniref:Uncharacterized protein n=1 Tax=Phytophthora fragariae TaxID=53985 RepID=A0A6A3U7K9_9STRA|nr:hypothetical protein PF010_g700 [Phytophthora fragariae]KAE9140460.1 hypothetical protein PF007_g634 [Phytophthora fragariae]KAE9145803.1 hypothetical protein PF006_g9378 [Phytophthora fragariae]KAE9255080.1 hypothetical protein PF004_g748 [Phytophthora fragariae]KAE9329777.1 hypothetical protein PF001_g728 [Phytophthora fragariae]